MHKPASLLGSSTSHLSTTYNPGSNRASNTPFTICDDADVLATVRVNQRNAANDFQVDGRGWESLGVFQFQSGKAVIRISDDADGIVIADGIRIDEVVPPAVLPSVIDDGDIRLTMGIYTHIGLNDQSSAIELLPAPPELRPGKVAREAEKRSLDALWAELSEEVKAGLLAGVKVGS